ncbi:MAG: ABC transporter permease, partial [Chitinophagales bacterium]
MFKSNFKIILRNLWKNKTFSAINIAGLSIGLAACLLILQYVSFKLSYDQFNPKVKDIYRVVNDRYQK